MKSSMWKIVLLLALLLPSLTYSIEGDVFGTWVGTEPVIVTGDITVPENKNLTIGHGVNVYFEPGTRMIVEGSLDILGTDAQPVLLSPASELESWGGLIFDGFNSDACSLSYVHIIGAYQGFIIRGTEVYLDNCQIDVIWSSASMLGAAFQIEDGASVHLSIVEATVSSVSSSVAVVNAEGSGLFILECQFDLNLVVHGIAPTESSAFRLKAVSGFMNNTYINVKSRVIEDNDIFAAVEGIAMYDDSGFEIEQVGIYLETGNQDAQSTGIIVGGSYEVLQLSRISMELFPTENDAFMVGLAVGVSGRINMFNSIVVNSNEQNESVYLAWSHSDLNTGIDISYIDYFNVALHEDEGVIFADTLTMISEDPDWIVDGYDKPYHLNASSPCIDMGNPASLYIDPDNTIADMGMHYFYTLESSETLSDMPLQFEIGSAYPNPFNGSTSVTVTLPQASYLNATVFDILGRQVAELAAGHYEAGLTRLNWNSSDAHSVSSGLYFLRISNSIGLVHTQRLVLIQ